MSDVRKCGFWEAYPPGGLLTIDCPVETFIRPACGYIKIVFFTFPLRLFKMGVIPPLKYFHFHENGLKTRAGALRRSGWNVTRFSIYFLEEVEHI